MYVPAGNKTLTGLDILYHMMYNSTMHAVHFTVIESNLHPPFTQFTLFSNQSQHENKI